MVIRFKSILPIIPFLFCINLLIINNVFAGTSLITYDPSCTPEKCSNNADVKCKDYCGNQELNDVLQKVVFVSDYILGICASLALLAFIIGGAMFLTSAGNPSWVEKGKATITGAVIGLAIVFLSYTIISFVITDIFQAKTDSSGKNAWDGSVKK